MNLKKRKKMGNITWDIQYDKRGPQFSGGNAEYTIKRSGLQEDRLAKWEEGECSVKRYLDIYNNNNNQNIVPLDRIGYIDKTTPFLSILDIYNIKKFCSAKCSFINPTTGHTFCVCFLHQNIQVSYIF